MPLQQYFSYIMVVSFIGGGNRGTLRKTPEKNGKLGGDDKISTL
jgi:hypothetical protein